MKLNLPTRKLITGLMTIGLVTATFIAPVQAGNTDENRNLFETPGQKQTAKDFKPAPARKTSFGSLEFEGGAFPGDASVQKIYDELDLQRATQAYMDFFPALSLYGIVKSQIRDFGFKTSSDVPVMADFMHPSENFLTGNDITVYAFASIDLKVDGPTVIEIPPNMYGTANDAYFRYITDMGATGLDKGKGGNGDQALAWFKQRLKVYPLATGPRQATATNASGMGANTLPPEDASAFAMLNEIIQYEPAELFNREQPGRLAALGIEKGKPFKPDARMQGIFEQAAKQGVAMSRAILYASREPEINYWPERHWEKMFVRNTEFLNNGHQDDRFSKSPINHPSWGILDTTSFPSMFCQNYL